MIDPKLFEEFSARISAFLPPGMEELRADFEKNTRASIQALFSDMNLITREEFEVQAGVLRRTREKLEALEKTVATLEARHKPASSKTAASKRKPKNKQ